MFLHTGNKIETSRETIKRNLALDQLFTEQNTNNQMSFRKYHSLIRF